MNIQENFKEELDLSPTLVIVETSNVHPSETHKLSAPPDLNTAQIKHEGESTNHEMTNFIDDDEVTLRDGKFSSYVKKDKLNQHILTSHCSIADKEIVKDEYTTVNDGASVTILYNCGKCGKDFVTQKSLTQHNKTHSKKTAMCSICFMRFTDKHEFKEHKLAHGSFKTCKNDGVASYNNRLKKYKCKLCSKTFLLQMNLHEHYQYHEKEKKLRQLKSREDLPKSNSYTCKICGKVFHNAFIYKHHCESHKCSQAPAIFTCEICKKFFKKEPYLKRHTKEIHMDDGKHCCRLCNKKFNRAELLRGHNEKHHWQDE